MGLELGFLGMGGRMGSPRRRFRRCCPRHRRRLLRREGLGRGLGVFPALSGLRRIAGSGLMGLDGETSFVMPRCLLLSH